MKKMKNESLSNLERVVFKPFKIGKRTIYPVVDILIINKSINILNVTPVALIIEENEDSYVLNLTYDEINDDELFELLLSYKNNLK